MPVIYCVKQANLTKNKSTSKCVLLDWVFNNDELNSKAAIIACCHLTGSLI